MNYGEIKNCDIANGIGVRITIFVSGCRNRCPGCFQPETWDFNYGKKYTDETGRHIMDLLAPGYITGLTLLGGDPFEPENQKELLELLKDVREKYPEKDIWAYTGYTYERLVEGKEHPCCEYTEEMLSNIDVLVDGRYIEEEKDISLQFRGSRNQRVIDVKKSRAEGRVILLPDRKRGDFYG